MTTKKVIELRALIVGEEEITLEIEEMFANALNLVLNYHSKSIKDKTDRVIHSSVNILSNIDTTNEVEKTYLDKITDNYFYHTSISSNLKQEWDSYKDLKSIPEDKILEMLEEVNNQENKKEKENESNKN